MPALESDAELMLGSLRQPNVFAGVFDRHAGAVFAYLARRVGRASAEDLLGEVFRIAFERRDAFRPEATNARPWLFGIATNLIHRLRRDEIRHLRALGQLGVPPVVPDPAAESVARLDDRVALEQLFRVLEQLPVRERDALLLFAWEDLSYPAIAEVLEIPVGTVRSRIHRARTRLKEALTELVPNARTVGGNDDGN